MTAFSLLVGVLVALLSVYALGLYGAALTFLLSRRRRRAPRPPEALATRAVTVLVPARNEGAMAVRALRSIIAQDTPAPVTAHLLIKDRDDTSWPHLLAAFPDACPEPGATTVVLFDGAAGLPGHRTVTVELCGVEGKADKIDHVLPRVATPLTAILDCDHQAHPDWLSAAVARLAEAGARVVQGRRTGLATGGLFSLWDSLHQHVGCELFNAAFTRHGLSAFVTGTTFVIDTALLRAHPLRPCLTEDTDLSYTLFMAGERVVADAHGGSDEEVSPNLYSFLARRRRWANGHTEAFLRHVRTLRGARLRLRDRVQFVFHGLHYLVVAVVFALHLVIGGALAASLPLPAVLGSLALGTAVAVGVARTQRTRGVGTRASEVAVLTAWFLPAALMLATAAHAWLYGRPLALPLPLPEPLLTVGLLAFLAPLAVQLAGLVGFRLLTETTLLTVVLTYPVAFYLDLAGILLGLTDFLAGRGQWQAVARAPAPAAVPAHRSLGHGGHGGGELLATSGAAMRALMAGPPMVFATDSAELLTVDEVAVDDVLAARAPAPHPHAAGGLTPVVSIPESWRLRGLLALLWRSFTMTLPRRRAPIRLILWLGLAGLFVGGFVASRASRLTVAAAPCTAMEHDSDPWIVAPDRIPGYCETSPPEEGSRWSRRRGSFEVTRRDGLAPPDPGTWEKLGTTFDCNLARFSPDNVVPIDGGGVELEVRAEQNGDRAYTAGSIATLAAPDARHRYGRFEVDMKAARGSGLISAFFLHRRDPWQEIDVEVLGRDTTKVLLNVYFNPGDPGDAYNYGLRGTPVLVDLGFDAAEAYHRYAIEWDTDELRWFVDDRLIHRRVVGRPTPIPNLPMRLYASLWPICSEELAGPMTQALPVSMDVRTITVSRRTDSDLYPIWHFYDGLLGDGPTGPEPQPPVWQDEAEWLQRQERH
ncbi:MAG: glycosyl hydrolase family protein [Deltaproteobacteria bacterium]|nr:MAG: glycosyl hydrolase family protein [Deltaproteobacteria bacterium]